MCATQSEYQLVDLMCLLLERSDMKRTDRIYGNLSTAMYLSSIEQLTRSVRYVSSEYRITSIAIINERISSIVFGYMSVDLCIWQ
jgi:hypothetical protein